MEPKSSLNPNAAPFIPASYQAVEDFSPEWWDLVQNSGWYRDFWLSQQQHHEEVEQQKQQEQQHTFFASHHHHHHEESNEDFSDFEDDIANLLPSTLDLGFDEEDYYTSPANTNFPAQQPQQQPQLQLREKYVVEPDVGALMKSLSLSPSAARGRYSKSTVVEPMSMMKRYGGTYHDKVAAAAAQYVSPRNGGPWRIYQPR